MDLTKTQNIIALLKELNLWASKKFGQNFLINRDILNKIIETADLKPDDYVIEIGPGLGVLTQELAKKAAKVTTIELDVKLIEYLQKTLPKNVEVIHRDALKFDPAQWQLDKAVRNFQSFHYKVVANIPYNITSPLTSHFLQSQNPPKTMTLLIQQEVAEKIVQKEPHHTVLSLQTQLFATPKIIRTVSRHCFFPAPKVTSAIIHLEILKNPHPQAKKIISLAKRAFSQKRKKLSNTLPEAKNILTQLNLNNLRPQNLSIKDWASIVEKL